MLSGHCAMHCIDKTAAIATPGSYTALRSSHLSIIGLCYIPDFAFSRPPLHYVVLTNSRVLAVIGHTPFTCRHLVFREFTLTRSPPKNHIQINIYYNLVRKRGRGEVCVRDIQTVCLILYRISCLIHVSPGKFISEFLQTLLIVSFCRCSQILQFDDIFL